MSHTDRGLGSLVHGRRQPLGGCELATAAVGLPAGERPPRRRRGAAADQLRRQHPLQHPRPLVAVLRVREERSLAVLHRPDVGQGQEHRQGGLRVPASQVPAPGVGLGRHCRQLQLQSARDRRLRRRGQQPQPDRRSLRVVPAGAGARCQPVHLRPARLVRELRVAVDQRRVQALEQAHGDRRTAPGLSDRPHRAERQLLDVRSEHAQPRRGRPARGRDLCGQRSGSYRITDVRDPEVGCLGTAAGILLSRQREHHRPRRLRHVLRRCRLLPVHR